MAWLVTRTNMKVITGQSKNLQGAFLLVFSMKNMSIYAMKVPENNTVNCRQLQQEEAWCAIYTVDFACCFRLSS